MAAVSSAKSCDLCDYAAFRANGAPSLLGEPNGELLGNQYRLRTKHPCSLTPARALLKTGKFYEKKYCEIAEKYLGTARKLLHIIVRTYSRRRPSTASCSATKARKPSW